MAKQDIKLVFVLQLAIILAPSSSLAVLTEEEMTVVAGDLGTVIGHSGLTQNSVDYIKFLGMPFAHHTRFLPSTLRTGPLNDTGDTYTALTPSLNCHQPNALPTTLTLDCLSINVWTRKVSNASQTSEDSRPVILFVHGGGMTIGNGMFFPGDLIINRDVVYVTFNYRLGTLGFFCLNNDDAPGNAGMYDVVTALDWVQRYIVYFGGDPNKVTLAGQSSGAVAVTLMMVSPLATGKFHRAIANSGSVLAEWGSAVDVKTSSLLMAGYCNCTGTDQEIHTCMMDVDPMCLVRELDKYQAEERLAGRIGFDPVTPVIQSFPLSVPILLESDPTNLFTEGNFEKVPLMMGATRHDGSYVMGMTYKHYLVPNNLTTDLDFMRNELVPKVLQALGIIDGSFGIYETLAKTYIGDARMTGDFDLMLPGLMDLHNVFYFKASAYRTAVLHSKYNNNDTYWYSFDYVGRQTMWQFLFALQPPYFPGGIAHGDDMLYLYPLIGAPNDPETAVINRMLDYWANFAEFGNPTPTGSNLTIWPSLDTRENKFLSINNDSLVMENYPDAWVDASMELFPELLPTEPPVETTTTEETPESTTDRQSVECSTGGGDNILVLPVTLTIAFSVISQLL